MDPTLRSGPSAGLPFHPGTNSTVWILLARSLYSLTQRKQNCFQHTCWNTVYRPCDARLRPRLHGHKPQENHNFSPPCKWKPRDIQRIEHIGVVRRVEVLSGSSCLYTTWFPESTQDAHSQEKRSPCICVARHVCRMHMGVSTRLCDIFARPLPLIRTESVELHS